MKSKSALFSAALMFVSMLHFGAQAAVTEYQITISGVGDPTTVFAVPAHFKPSRFNPGVSFELGPIAQFTNGVAMTDAYTFYHAGGLSDSGALYTAAGARLYGGSESNPIFADGRSTFINEKDGALDTIVVAGIPEIATWAMMAAGFGALALAGHRFHGGQPRRIMVSVDALSRSRTVAIGRKTQA